VGSSVLVIVIYYFTLTPGFAFSFPVRLRVRILGLRRARFTLAGLSIRHLPSIWMSWCISRLLRAKVLVSILVLGGVHDGMCKLLLQSVRTPVAICLDASDCGLSGRTINLDLKIMFTVTGFPLIVKAVPILWSGTVSVSVRICSVDCSLLSLDTSTFQFVIRDILHEVDGIVLAVCPVSGEKFRRGTRKDLVKEEVAIIEL